MSRPVITLLYLMSYSAIAGVMGDFAGLAAGKWLRGATL